MPRAMSVKSPLNAAVGLVSTLICGAFIWGGVEYGLGSVARIGPGFFPAITGVVGLLLSLVILASAFRTAEPSAQEINWRPAVFILLAIVSFAFIVEQLGLVPAVFVSGALAAFGDSRTRIHEALAIAAAMSGGIWLVFIVLLRLPVPSVIIS